MGPKNFSDLLVRFKQTTLVRFPNQENEKTQSAPLSSGKKARKVVRRIRRKKEEVSMDVNQRSIKDFFMKEENSCIISKGKRKNEIEQTEENKKFKVGSSDYSPGSEFLDSSADGFKKGKAIDKE